MNFSFYIAKRYIFSRSKSTAINIISFIALYGIIAGTWAMFVFLSVFSGLRTYSIQFTNDYDPDLKLFPETGKYITLSPDQLSKLKAIDGINRYSKIVEERVLFYFNEKEQVTYLKGVDAEFRKINKITQNLFNGQWLQPDTYQAVIGYGTSQKLSLGLFDVNNPLIVYVPKPGKGLIESEEQAFNKEFLTPFGIYAVNEEIDSKYVFVDLSLAQQLMGYNPNQVSGLEIQLKPNADSASIIPQLRSVFGNSVTVKTREEMNSTLHKMLNTENLVVYLVSTLVLIITLFSLIGSLIMIILEKKNNLVTLKNLGAEVPSLRRIFLYQGMLLSFTGGSIGLLLGVITVWAQKQFGLVMINESLAYPIEFTLVNVAIVCATILSLGYIASRIAGSRVSEKLLHQNAG